MENCKTSILLIGMNKDKSDEIDRILKDSNITILSVISESHVLVCNDYSEFECLIIDHKVWSDSKFKIEYSANYDRDKAIPVIFTGDQNKTAFILESFEKGADDFISFPFK